MEFVIRLWSAIRGPSRNVALSLGAWITIGGPIATFICVSNLNMRLPHPAAFLTLMALLFGGYLSAFVHYSTLRLRLTENQQLYQHADAPERKLADSVAALLLAGASTSVMSAALLAVSMSVVGDSANGFGLAGGAAYATWTLSSVPVFLFLYTAPLLFRGYDQLVSTPLGAKHH